MIARLNAALTDRYRVERELGAGGMATVYLAEDLRHARKVALKVLKPELAAVVGGDRFLSEIETTARLQHPNILPLFDSGEADGFLFYVMPYVEGESLRDRLDREKQLPVAEALRIATEVAEALHSAHQHGVVHRDIKPANILLSQGRPLVADFGIALALSAAGGHRLTETGLSVGTPQYMSPEQATGDQRVGSASDVYSLGCLLYEMLVGEPPYTGSTAQAILGKVITSDPERVTAQRRSVPPHVDAVVSKALEKLPADRFGSAAEFAHALADEGFRYGAGSGALSPTRLKGVTLAGWALAAVMAALWAISAFESESVPPVRRLSLAVNGDIGPSEWMAFSPDGSTLILSDGPRGNDVGLVVRRLDDLALTPLPGSRGGIDPAVSPDGQTVAFGSGNGLYLAPVAGGSVRTLVPEGVAACLRWADDGYIYYTNDGADVLRVRAAGGEPELVLAADTVTGEGVAYYEPLPGGRHAVLSTVSDPPRIELMDTESGRREVLAEGVLPFATETGHLVFFRNGGIYAASVDLDDMALTASPVLLVEQVAPVEAVAAMYTLSRTGDLAYWITHGEEPRPVRELVWVDRQGNLTSVDTTFLGNLESVEISPGGERAAVTVGEYLRSEIWIKDLDAGPARRLTNYQGMNRRPVWSPDGTTLAFISDRGARRAVYSVKADGIASPELLLEHPGEDVDEVFWSSDGEWLVYRTGTAAGARDIYARRLGPDTVTIAVSAQPGVDERAPVLSPDGRWVAYVSNQTGDDQVWVRPFPDVERGSRQVSVDLGLEPTWSTGGDELYFRSRPGFMAAAVRTAPEFSSGELRPLFPNRLSVMNTVHRAYTRQHSRDRFLMIRELGQEEVPAELVLVQNFIEEVKTRVGS